MPIKPESLPSLEPDSAPPTQEELKDVSQYVAETQQRQEQEAPKRTRRTKKQMVADAVIPGDSEMVEVKDLNTGAKIQRNWRDAVSLVQSGAVEFTDKAMKYALEKEAQQSSEGSISPPGTPPAEQIAGTTSSFLDPQPVATENIEQPQPAPSANVPPDAQLGDEVRVGSETLRVGYDRALTNSPVADANGEVIRPARRWQRELGAGLDGPWQQTPLTMIGEPRPILEKSDAPIEKDSQNGNGVTVQTERLPREMEELGDNLVKIGTGILEKIGMPQVEQFASASQFQVGPITASRTIFDDGRRTPITFDDGREGEVITAVVEGYELLENTVEYVAKRFRGQLFSFLAATGAIKQSVA
jgi:hypothetical protein